MANPNIAWMSSAAHLYVLHLDESQLAWEYLRRNPIYRRDWLHSRADRLQRRIGGRAIEDVAEHERSNAVPDSIHEIRLEARAI